KVMRGHNVTIHCRVRNLGAYNVFWLKDSTVLSLNHLIMTSNDRYSIVGRYNLQINDVEDGDEAKYQCQVSSFPPISQFHSIMVTVPPTVEMVNKTKVVEATLGDDIVFQCTATGRPHPNITWVRQDKMMPYGEDYIFGDTLRLSSLEYNHGGLYKCIASNDVGDDAEDSVRLKVFYAPKIYTEEKVIITGPGEEVSVPCLASAQPSPKVEWRHNGDKISLRSLPQNKELRAVEQGFKTDYTLYIKSLQDSDFGNYTCVVKNNRGKAIHKLVLTPLPSKSEIMSDIKGNYSNVFELEWMTVSVVKLDNYKLMIRNVSQLVINETLTGNWSEVDIEADMTSGPIHSQSYMVKDLEPETMYEVILQAHNNYGWGE
ncbi:hypothetical protein LOTGIDRAFT_93532, partial [Lottia gigantea]